MATGGAIDHEGEKNGESSAGQVQVLNNLEWFKEIGFLEFLRDVGKLAKVNTMISRDRCDKILL